MRSGKAIGGARWQNAPAVPAPEISVVIPTLDRRTHVSQALEAVLSQQEVDLEAIVVDDGSSDGTSDAVAAIGDPRARVIRHETPLGAARSRNDGLAAAAGEWVAFLDDDDLWAPRKLRDQLDAAAAVDATMAFSPVVVVDASHRVIGLDPAPQPEGLLADLLRHNSIPGGCSNVIATTALVRAVGGFDEQLSVLADWDLWLRLAEAGKAAASTEPCVGYVEHEAGMHVQHAVTALRELPLIAGKRRAASGAPLAPESEQWLLLWVASGQHRAGHRLLATRTYLQAAVAFRSLGALRRALASPFSDRLVVADGLAPLRPLPSKPPWLPG
jgi:hypothetical protein